MLRFPFFLSCSLVLIAAVGLHAGPVPTGKPTNYPDWWFEHDVIPRLDPANLTPNYNSAETYSVADDFAAVNIGQLKNIASKAAAELNASLPSPGAGSAINDLIASWSPGITNPSRDDYAALNQGQLKFVARIFYDRLAALGYIGYPLAPLKKYPWSSESSDDEAYALVNLGQLKYLFSYFSSPYFFDPYLADADGDGMPDGWEIEQGLNPANPADAGLVSGGITNLVRYQQWLAIGNDPTAANSAGLIVYSP